MRVHHVGYYVKNLNEALEEFKGLGYEIIQATVHDADRKVKICFVKNGSEIIELVEPDEACPYINKQLRKLGCSPYHVCYKVDDLSNAIRYMQKRGYYLVQEAAPAVAIGGRKVAFMYHDAVGILELLEVDDDTKTG